MSSSPSELDTLLASAAKAGQEHGSSAVVAEVVELFDELQAPLLRYLAGFSLNLPDSEDVVQETFLALFVHLKRAKSRHNLHAWLFRVAHNLALKMRLRSRRQSTCVSSSPMTSIHKLAVDPAPNPEDQFAANERRMRIADALNSLPEQNRWCLFLRAEGLRYREIAEVLDISLGGVSLSLERCLAHIARAIER